MEINYVKIEPLKMTVSRDGRCKVYFCINVSEFLPKIQTSEEFFKPGGRILMPSFA